MRQEITFTNNQVSRFCEATHDKNIIHNPHYMSELNKQVVVPGMYVFATAVNILKDVIRLGADTIRVFFNSVIHTDETVEISGTQTGYEPIEMLMSANNGHDSFTLKDQRSKLYKRTQTYFYDNQGYNRALEYNSNQIDIFSKLTGCADNLMSGLLFSVAYASNALFQAIQFPVTEVEHEINVLIDKTLNPDQVSPFYQSLDVYLPENIQHLEPNGQLDYLIDFEREKANRTYVAHVTCTQNNNLIYKSDYKMISVPERLIMRMVKDKIF